MKKISYLLIIIVIAIGSYLVGTRANQQSSEKLLTAGQSSQPEKEVVPQEEDEPSSLLPGTVRVSPKKQQVVGVQVGQVERSPFTHTIRLLGKVAPDETRVYFINATVDGWITKTFPNTTGSFVKKDETLAAFYSPEFLSAGQALLFALSSQDRVQTTGKENTVQKVECGSAIVEKGPIHPYHPASGKGSSG